MTAENDALNLADASDDDLKAMGLPGRFTLEELQGALSKEEIDALAEEENPVITLPGEDDDEDDDPNTAAAEGGDDTQPGVVEEVELIFDNAADPVVSRPDVSAHQKVIDTDKQERAAIREKYADGDLTDDEMDAQIDALNDKLVEAKIAIKDADRDLKTQQAEYAASWYSKVKVATTALPSLINDSPIAELEGASALGLFDYACRQVNRQPQFANLTQAERVKEAVKITKAVYKDKTGKDLGAPAPAAAKEAETKAAKPADLVRKQGKRPEPVQTLGTVTSATEMELDDGKFAAIDNASGMDRERLLSRLSQAEQEAYLRG